MSLSRFTVASAVLTLAATLFVGVAEAAPPKAKKCTDLNREQAQHSECISPTFPNQSPGQCTSGACYRSGIQKHKKPKTRT